MEAYLNLYLSEQIVTESFMVQAMLRDVLFFPLGKIYSFSLVVLKDVLSKAL